MKTIQEHQNANLKAMENHVNTRLALCTGGSVEGAATTAFGSTFGYGKYAQILAGRHWRTQPDAAAAAAGAAAGSAGTRASVSGPHHKTWQV